MEKGSQANSEIRSQIGDVITSNLSKFSVLKLSEIVILWVYFTIPFGLGSLTKVQYPKCAYGPYCELNPIQNGVYIYVEVSFSYFKYLASVTAGGPRSPRAHM